MKKRISFILVLAILCFTVLGGCGNKKEEGNGGGKADAGEEGSAGGGSDVKVAIVCSGAGQNDNGYNQSACDGIKELSEETGCEYKVIEPANGVPEALETLAGDGYNLIFTLEYDFDAYQRISDCI